MVRPPPTADRIGRTDHLDETPIEQASLETLLRRDHDAIAELFDQLAAIAGLPRYSSQIARIAPRLVATVRIHERAEERVVYDALLLHPGPLKSFALAGPHEHEMLDITLDKLLVMHAGEELEVVVGVAHDLFVMHARDEEEPDILPVCERVLAPDERIALAREFVAEKARIRIPIERMVGLSTRLS